MRGGRRCRPHPSPTFHLAPPAHERGHGGAACGGLAVDDTGCQWWADRPVMIGLTRMQTTGCSQAALPALKCVISHDGRYACVSSEHANSNMHMGTRNIDRHRNCKLVMQDSNTFVITSSQANAHPARARRSSKVAIMISAAANFVELPRCANVRRRCCAHACAASTRLVATARQRQLVMDTFRAAGHARVGAAGVSVAAACASSRNKPCPTYSGADANTSEGWQPNHKPRSEQQGQLRATRATGTAQPHTVAGKHWAVAHRQAAAALAFTRPPTIA